MLITVTGDDEDNLVSCQVAKYKFNVPRTIARVRNPNNERLFKILGVDVTINSTNIILEHLAREVPSHPVTRLMSLQDKEVEIVELHIQAGSPAVGRALKDIELPARVAISLIIRPDQKPVVPRGDTVLEAGDRVLAVTPGEAEPALRAALTGG
jgi:trk system potassium uptake protein TrkA